MLAIFGAIGSLTALMLYPSLRATLADITGTVDLLYFGLCLPGAFACVALMLRDPPPVLREGLIAGADAAFSLCVLYLFISSGSANIPIFAAVAILLVIYATVGIQLRFPYALAVTLCILAVYARGLHVHPEISRFASANLLILAACSSAYALLANWRLERQFRRNYLVSLRERLQRQDLASRNRELDELSRRDPLTGLANRRAYDLWLARAWQQAEATGGDLGLIVIDIDRFKLYNDTYGHAEGDACLRKISTCLGEQLRNTSDLVARLGGEEFAILLPRLTEDVCADVAERLRLAVAALDLPHGGLGRDRRVSVSAGVASRLGGKAENPARLFAAADAALYEAKAAGRDQIRVSTVLTK